MRALYVADAFIKWKLAKETTPLMIREARRRGTETFTCTHLDLGFDAADPVGWVAEIRPDGDGLGFSLGPRQRRALADFDVIHLRTDPPFALSYYFATLVAEVAAARSLVINDPVAVRAHNEKLSILRFPDLICETIVSADPEEILAFVETVGGRAVLKPLYRCSGQGVVLIEGPAQQREAVLQAALRDNAGQVLLQRYLPEVVDRGETRLTVIGGEAVGWMRKIPKPGSFLANLDFGASVASCELSEKERRVMAQVGPFLRHNGIQLAAVDTIDGHLSEINITSPGLLLEMNQVNSSELEVLFEDLIERLQRERGRR